MNLSQRINIHNEADITKLKRNITLEERTKFIAIRITTIPHFFSIKSSEKTRYNTK